MKVLLVNSPIENMIALETPALVKRNEGVFPPLGLLYIASYLKKHVDCQVKILDTLARDMSYEEIEKYIRGFYPDIVGINAHTHNLIDAIKVADLVKKIKDNTYVCFGGPHVNIFPRETIKIKSVDFVVLGEGEEIFADLVRCIKEKNDFRKVKGILLKQGEEVIQTAQADSFPDINRLSFPDRGLLDNSKYCSILGESSIMTTMVSSRGCPYSCSFCSTHRGFHRVRSAKNIADEIEECIKIGINEVHFVDDTFNVNAQRVIRICEEIKKRKLKLKWSFRGRVNGITKPFLAAVKEAGCYRIHLGVETSSDEGLIRLNKGITIEEVRRVFKWIRHVRIRSAAYFLIGCPHERRREDILRTINFAKEINPDFVLFNILTPYPSTRLYEEGIKKGLFKNDYWREFALNPRKDFAPCFWEEYFNNDQLRELLIFAYKKFYLRPKFLMRVLTNPQNLNLFFRKIKTGIDILKA